MNESTVKQSLITRILGKIRNAAGDLGVVIALVLLCILMSILSPHFFTSANLLNVLMQVSVITVVAIGMTFVILIGGIDLSVGSNVAATGLFAAILMQNVGLGVGLSILLALIFATVIGLINGALITILRLPPFIATLAMLGIVRGIAYTISNGIPLYTFDESFTGIAGRVGEIPIPAIIMIVVFILGSLTLKYTKLGRYCYAIGGNETASILSGIRVKRYKLAIYTICGFCSGIASILITARLDSAVPTTAEGYELDAIAAVVIGGTSMMGGEGKLWGTLVGALIIGVVGNGLNLLTVSAGEQRIAKGIIIIIAVAIDMFKKRDGKA